MMEQASLSEQDRATVRRRLRPRSEHVAGLGSIHVGQARLSASTPSMSAKPLKADIRELAGKVSEVP